mgnify:CR=1 FL=1
MDIWCKLQNYTRSCHPTTALSLCLVAVPSQLQAQKLRFLTRNTPRMLLVEPVPKYQRLFEKVCAS